VGNIVTSFKKKAKKKTWPFDIELFSKDQILLFYFKENSCQLRWWDIFTGCSKFWLHSEGC